MPSFSDEQQAGLLGRAGLAITVVTDSTLPVVMTDRWLLRRVLNNLVVNAVRHSAAGRVDLEAQLTGEAGDLLQIRVRDSGRDIPAEEQAGLFQRAPRRRGAEREDTGLGLIFCKMAVERMGGTIAIESAPGTGTTFLITLPSEAPL